MLRIRLIILVTLISSVKACSSSAGLEINQSEPNFIGDETENSALEDLKNEVNSDTAKPEQQQADASEEFREVFISVFNDCARDDQLFDFKTGDCSLDRPVEDCTYSNIISGEYSNEIEVIIFNKEVSEDSLIQCFRHDDKKMIQVAHVSQDGYGNLSIELSCWVDTKETCNI